MDSHGGLRVNLNDDRWVNHPRRVNHTRRVNDDCRFDDGRKVVVDVDLVSTHIIKDGVQKAEGSSCFRQRLISLKLAHNRRATHG